MLASLISDKTKAKKSHENRKKTAGVDEVDDVGRPVDEAREILEREGMTS